MSDAGLTSRVWIKVIVTLLALAVSPACATMTARRQTDVMTKQGEVSVSAAVLRAQVNDLADRLAGRIEETADRILAATREPAVRRRALAFKADGVPAVFTAAYRADPLTAAVDVWVLAFQIVQYVEDGAGRESFGAEQPLARTAARGMLADADAVIQQIAARPEDFVRARRRREDWANQHPIEHALSSRASVVVLGAQLRSEERDAFVSVGEVSDTIENVSERLNTYASQLPRQARWQAQLLAMDLAEDREVQDVMGDVHAVGAAARRANDLLGDVPGVLAATESPVRELLAAERRAVLAGVDSQRVATLEYVTAERLAVLAALREERLAFAEFFRQERIDGLKEADAIKTRGVDSAVLGLQQVVDYALWRVGALVVFLMLTATMLGVVGYRLTVGSRRA